MKVRRCYLNYFFCIAIVIFTLLNVEATLVSYEGHQLWKILPQTDKTLRAIKDLQKTKGVEIIAHNPVLYKSHLFRVPPTLTGYVERFLSNRGVDFSVTVKNLQTVINRQKRLKRSLVANLEDFVYSEYHNYEEIDQWMDLVVKNYSFITKQQIGVTYEGRKLNLLKISKPGKANKPVIYLDAMTHAREWITTASLLFIWNEILTKPENEWMINDIDWYFVPVVNIDGYIYTWTNDRNWRKTRSETVVNNYGLCQGVDANRNWNDHWSMSSSNNPCTYVYHGPMPGSEAVIRHLMLFIYNHKDEIKGVFSCHSYGQLLMYPYTFAKGKYTKDYEEHKSLAEDIVNAMYSVHNTTYTPGQGAEALDYNWSGSTIDWTYEKAGIKLSYTVELRDTGKYAFFLPPDQIVPTGEELFEGIRVYARHVRDNS